MNCVFAAAAREELHGVTYEATVDLGNNTLLRALAVPSALDEWQSLHALQ